MTRMYSTHVGRKLGSSVDSGNALLHGRIACNFTIIELPCAIQRQHLDRSLFEAPQADLQAIRHWTHPLTAHRRVRGRDRKFIGPKNLRPHTATPWHLIPAGPDHVAKPTLPAHSSPQHPRPLRPHQSVPAAVKSFGDRAAHRQRDRRQPRSFCSSRVALRTPAPSRRPSGGERRSPSDSRTTNTAS